MRATLSAICVSLALAPAAARAQDADEEVVRGRDPDARAIAMTPLADLNLATDEVPEALRDAVIAPYASEKLVDCAAIASEVERLQAVLGPDVELDVGQERLTVGRVAQGVVGSLIPFRGVIREVSGAADRQREFEAAIYAGAVRRGFLKGIGQERGCDWPARPATTAEREAYLASLETAPDEDTGRD